jgi:hypothetical protein
LNSEALDYPAEKERAVLIASAEIIAESMEGVDPRIKIGRFPVAEAEGH